MLPAQSSFYWKDGNQVPNLDYMVDIRIVWSAKIGNVLHFLQTGMRPSAVATFLFWLKLLILMTHEILKKREKESQTRMSFAFFQSIF